MRFLSVFDKNSPTPAIDLSLGLLDAATSNQVGAYLRAGVPLMQTTQKVPDAVTGSPAPIVPITILTDGEYVWSLAVAFYVETHQISPGDEFIAHCAGNDWSVPELSSALLAEGLAFVNASRPAR